MSELPSACTENIGVHACGSEGPQLVTGLLRVGQYLPLKITDISYHIKGCHFLICHVLLDYIQMTKQTRK